MAPRRSARIHLSPIKEIELAAARRPGVVSLAQGIPSFDTPEAIKNHVKEKLDQGAVARYSLAPGLVELRELVAEHLGREGMRYDPDGEILITAGSIEGIAATLLALTNPGDEVILPSPSYASYQEVIRMAGCEPRFVPLDEERNFDLDVGAIARAVTPRTAALFYCNPNNPTGTIYSRAQSLRLMELAERHGLYIITDEAYKDFLYTDETYFTPAQEEAFRRRVVRIYSFSKSYAMTGWRVAYLHSDRRNVAEILKVHDSLVTCAPVISQHAAVAALDLAGDAVAEFRAAYRRRRDLTLRHLDALSHIFDYQKPAGAYFVFPRVKDTVALSHDSRALAFDLLERAGVALVPGSAFGPTGEHHLRLSFGREDADIEEAFARLRAYFQGPQRSALPAHPRPVPAAPGGGRLRRGTRGLAVRYLSALARLFLRRRRPVVVAIAGSRGKTVVKRTVLGLLRRRFAARANPRSYNTEIGLPLAVLGLEIQPRDWRNVLGTLLRATLRAAFSRERLELLVLEMGTRRPGDMAELLRTVRPDWAVVTNLVADDGGDPAELAVQQAEMAALCAALPPGRLLLSADDRLLADLRANLGGDPATFSRDRLTRAAGGFRFQGAEGAYDLGDELVGESALYAVQVAVLLGERLGIPRPDIEAFLGEETRGDRPGRDGKEPYRPPPAAGGPIQETA